jgi:YD repeat-containing protein
MEGIGIKNIRALIMTAFLAVVLTACGSGGGGGDNGTVAPLTTVSGTVLDANGNPIQGASVTVFSTPKTTATDENGNFSVEVEVGNHTLVIKVGGTEIYNGPIVAGDGMPSPDIPKTSFVPTVVVYTIGAGGTITKEEYDNNNDGTVDKAIYYEEDKGIRKEKHDEGVDGIFEKIVHYVYNADGTVMLELISRSPGGSLITYDSSGNLTTAEHDDGDNGSIDKVITYTYDSSGNLTTAEHDDGDNGSIDKVITYTYDSSGNLTREEHDDGDDGSIDKVITYTHDSSGNIIAEEHDNDNNGTIDSIIVHVTK